MILGLHGHLGGSTISALVDGQLDGGAEDRAWDHLVGCPGCRRRVEHERWVKQQLAGLAAEQPRLAAPEDLVGTLYDVDAWAAADTLERQSTRRRTTALVGAGSIGIAVMAVMTLASPPVGREVPRRVAPASVQGGVPRPMGPQVPVGVSAGVSSGTGLDSDFANAAWGRRTR